MKKKKEVFVCTLSTNNYLEGVLLLVDNLRFLDTKYDILCLINETIDEHTKSILDYFNIKYKLFSSIEYNNQDEFNTHWIYTFDKLNLFKLTEYDKIVYLDSDFLILKNIDNLFKYEPLSLPLDLPFKEDKFCSCVMVIKPNLDDYNNLVALAMEKNKQGEKISDQDVINEYFKGKIKKLPPQYNFVRIIGKHEVLEYDYLTDKISYANFQMSLNYTVENPIIIHYIGPTKPFMVKNDFVDDYKYLYDFYLERCRKKVKRIELLNKDLISIIVPLCNKKDYIDKCIESILNQTYSNFELIIVNDKSKDNSVKICESYAKKDKRIKIINTKEKKSISHARNVGIDNANGEYLCFINAEDTVLPNYLETLHLKIRTYNTTFIQCGIDKDLDGVLRMSENDLFLNDHTMCFDKFLKGNVSKFVFDKMIHKSMFREKGLRFNELYNNNEELLFIVQLLDNFDSLIVINNILYNKNDLSTDTCDYDINKVEIIKYIEDLAIKYNYNDPNIWFCYKLCTYEALLKGIIDKKLDSKELLKDSNFALFLEKIKQDDKEIHKTSKELIKFSEYVMILRNNILEEYKGQ